MHSELDAPQRQESCLLSALTILVTANVIVFVMLPAILPGHYPTDLVALGAESKSSILAGQWWRFITSTLIHIELMHLLANMVLLLSVGATAERSFGWWSFLVIYFGSSCCVGIMLLLYAPDTVSYGASAAVSGVVGAVLASYCLPVKISFAKQRWRVLWVLVLVMYLIWIDLSRQDHWLHVAGMVAGAIIGLIIMTMHNKQSVPA